MIKFNYFCILFLLYCSPLAIWSGPIVQQEDLTACIGASLYTYDAGKEYLYDYSTKTKLWINDVSDEAESNIYLNATVVIQLAGPCRYQLKLQDVRAYAASIDDYKKIATQLETNVAVFTIGSNGAISSSVKFNGREPNWSQNIKRGIISAFQLRSENDLKVVDPLNPNSNEPKSSVVYETDNFGRCRTTYKLRKSGSGFEIVKKKALHRCTLNLYRSSPIQGDEYKSVVEYYNGHVFVENYKCKANVNNKILNKVECEHESTFRPSSRGDNGVQAVAEQVLEFRSQRTAQSPIAPLDRAAPSSIVHDYEPNANSVSNFDVNKYLSNVCANTANGLLDADHTKDYRELVLSLKTKSKADLLKLLSDAVGKCKFAGHTVLSAIVFTGTESSVEAVLDSVDKDLFKDTVLLTEYPLLTAVARNRNPSVDLINKFKTYLTSKDAKFPYLQKLYLIYSSIVKTYCSDNDCSKNIADWTSFLAANLGSNCLDSKNPGTVVATLKAIGNAGYLKDTSVLEKCAANKENSLEVRVAAVQSFRRFACQQVENLDGNYKILQDSNDDTEVRINAFRVLVKCLNSNKFQTFASKAYSDLLLKDEDYQLVSYIIDFAKERGVTVLLNPILSNPEIRDKLQLNFKEFSWNNYKFRYSVTRDAAIETDASVIYSGKTFIPRSVNLNLTLHGYGIRVNEFEITIRLEGLDEVLKAILVDKIPAEQLVKILTEQPEQLLDILKLLAAKLKYQPERPYASVAIRIYGSDIFFIQLDSADKFLYVGSLLKDWKNILYKEKNVLKNMQLLNGDVKRALANGFEFDCNIDVNYASLTVRKGDRQIKGTKTEFNLKSYKGASLFVQRQFDVKLNNDNRLSIKKTAQGSLRLRLDMDGSRQDGSVVYNINFPQPQQETIQLFTLEGKFFKLGKGSAYVPVTNFKIPQTTKSICTSENFHEHVGLDLCLAVQRPTFRRIREIVKSIREGEKDLDVYEDSDDFDFDAVDDDDDDNDSDDKAERPMITLAGPYRYEVALKNRDGIQKFTLNAKTTKTENSKLFEASLESSSLNKRAQRRLELVYSRNRQVTSRTYNRGFLLELKVPQDNDVRFHISSKLDYRKKELLDYQLKIDNKILKEISGDIHFNRKHKTDDQIVSNYTLNASYRSNINAFSPEGANLNLLWEFYGIGKSIKSDFYIENHDFKFIEAQLSLDKRVEAVYDKDYDLVFNAKSFTGKEIDVSGHVGLGLLASDIDINGKYSSPDFSLPTPINIKAGHAYSSSGESHILMEFSIPFAQIFYGTKLTFELGALKRSFGFEVHTFETKLNDSPRKVFFLLNKADESQDDPETQFQMGFKNFKLDLTERTSRLAELLKKVDGDPILRSIIIEVSITKDKQAHRKDITFEIKKNDVSLDSVHLFYQGDLQTLRSSKDELPEQNIGAGFDFKALDYKGGLKANIKLSHSKSKGTRSYNVNILASDLIKPLVRLSEVDISTNLQAGKLDFKALISKEASDYKTLELNGNGNARLTGSNDINFNYIRTFNDDKKKTGKGTLKYTITDFKNFDASIQVPGSFEAKAALTNDGEKGTHKAKLNLKYLDQPNPVEKNFEFDLIKANNKVEVSLKARNGKVGQLDKIDQLNYLVEVGGKLAKMQLPDGTSKVVAYEEYLRYISKQRNVDINSQSSFSLDLPNRQLVINSKTNAKFPALLSDPKQQRFLNRDLQVKYALDKSSATISGSFETDSTVLGRFVRYFKINYQRKLSTQKLVEASLNADYKLAPSEQNPSPNLKNFKLNLNISPCAQQGCFDLQLASEQQAVPTCTKGLLNGIFKISGADRNSLIINTNVNIKCDDKLFTDTGFTYSKTPNAQLKFKREIKITSKSDLYEPKSLDLALLPFNKLDGYARIAYQTDKQGTFDSSFEYKRELVPNSNKMQVAQYKANFNFANMLKKSCELNINKKAEYQNSLSCTMNIPSIPKPLTYGYKIVSISATERFFGKRKLELSVQLPTGRVLLIDYKGNKATPIDNTDDDSDPNDEREFNGTANLYWDYANDKKKAITVNLKRDNIAPGHFKFFIETVNTPNIKVARLELNDKRSFNETNLKLSLSYELQNGRKNRFDLSGKLNSDLDESSFLLEANLERPKFNILYSNEFNKQNGQLKLLKLRVANLLNFIVDKEYDPNNRKISLELNSYDANKYKIEANSKFQNNIYTVDGVVKQGAKSLSTIKSVYDSSNTNFVVNIDAIATKTKYELRVGIFNESYAIGQIKQDSKILGVASVNFVPVPVLNRMNLHEIVATLRWNRFWHKLQEDILGGIDSPSASQNSNLPAGFKFNSYFGDAYGEIVADLKPIIENVKQTRAAIREDLFKSLVAHLEFYGTFSRSVEELRQGLILSAMADKSAPAPEKPLYIRLFERYNSIADTLDGVFLRVYSSRFKRFAKYVPRPTRISYNEDQTGQFGNNLVLEKKTLRASNLYQFNAEFRNRIRIIGNVILRVKSLLVRDIKTLSLRALFNKYKYRSIRYDYTMAASVFNRRNIIGFGGESEILHTKSRFLLAHDTHKNRFSVILNFDDQPNALSVFFYGKGPIGINHDKAYLNNKPIALPHEIKLQNGKSIFIGRTHNGICAHVDNEVKACCYEDSNSCTVALTRWYTGKVNGLFGKSNNFPLKLRQEDWSVDRVDFGRKALRPANEEAVKKCYQLFGKHRHSPFKYALMSIRPNGWRKVCETALTADMQKNYCPLIRAFAEHSEFEYVHVDVPTECFQCQNSNIKKTYKINENVNENESTEASATRGSDFVFVSLPCDSKKFSFDYDTLLKQFNKDKSQFNNYYVIRVDNDETSVYQAENGQYVNFDVKAAASVLQKDAKGKVQEEAFIEALYVAQTLFAKRVASARHLVILSCGNCLPYSARKVRKLSKQLAARNIIVSSWGDYTINLGSDATPGEAAVGYNENDLFIHSRSSNEFTVESVNSFKADHEGDLCHRLASRTHGSVFDLKEIRKPQILQKVPEWFQGSREEHSFTIKSCEIVHNKHYGDFADFEFGKIFHEKEDDDDDEVDDDDDDN